MTNSNVDDSIEIIHGHHDASAIIIETLNANHVPVQINHGHHHVASENNTVEVASTNDVPIEMNHGHHVTSVNNTIEVTSANENHGHHVASVNNTVEVTSANDFPVQKNHVYDHVPFNNAVQVINASNVSIEMSQIHDIAGYVTNALTGEKYEINHVHYRFAYDLVETVLEIRGELNPDVPHNLPDPPYYLFTKEHKAIIENLLETKYRDTTNLLREIYNLTKGKYELLDFLNCRNYFSVYWQRVAYTEKSFISACAVIAYTAAHFIQVNVNSGALDNAVSYIASWVAVIRGRGTLDQSRW